MSYKRITLNPLTQIEHIFKIDGYEGKISVEHISFDPVVDMIYDYQIIRESSHDGTLLFTKMLVSEALEPLVRGQSYCARDLSKEDMENVTHIHYTIGNIELESEYGYINTTNGKIPGVTETVTIPVQCKYTFKGE